MRIFISAGEPSGDLHAANLVRALRKHLPDAEFVGFGGPHLERAGARLLFRLTDLAVMWFLQVFQNLRTFFRLADQVREVCQSISSSTLIPRASAAAGRSSPS